MTIELPELAAAFGTDQLERGLPTGAAEAVAGLSPVQGEWGLERGLSNLMRMAGPLAGTFLGEGLRTAVTIALIAALCAAACSLTDGMPAQYVRIAAVLGIAALTVTGLQSLMAQGREAIAELDTYSKALLPSMAAAAAASGQPTAAIARQAATAFAGDLFITMSGRLLMPLLYVYAALITLNAALPQDILKRLAGLVKWMVTGLLALGLTAFTAWLAISGVIAGQADSLAVRGAKAALSGAVPVVGGIIGDASEAVVAGAGVIKNTIGVFGLFVVLGTVLSPLIMLGTRYLIFKLGAALCGTVGDETIAGYIDGIAGLYAMLLAIIGAMGVLLIISITSCIMMVG